MWNKSRQTTNKEPRRYGQNNTNTWAKTKRDIDRSSDRIAKGKDWANEKFGIKY